MLAALRLYGSQLARQRELHGVAPARVQLQVSWVAISYVLKFQLCFSPFRTKLCL